MSFNFDPIFALASPSLRSAIHLHRISGRNLLDLLSNYIYKPNNHHELINIQSLLKRSLGKSFTQYVYIKDQHLNLIDDVILNFFPAPNSYTGEDVIEIGVHGNPLISANLQSLLRYIGMRDAEPGEFTQRAVLNGKIDLAQAEGINQLIHTETIGGIHLARNTVEGVLSKETELIRDQLIQILSYLEAHIDFAPDEVGDYNPSLVLPQMQEAKSKLNSLLKTYSTGLKIREGVKVALVGKPNAGKSSLYNALLRYERAIVTNIPGTTRDVLEDRLVIDNKDFVLLDTAGIRDTIDTVEKIGVERSLKTVSIADIICLIINLENMNKDSISNFIMEEIINFLNEAKLNQDQKILIVFSKKDLLEENISNNLQDIFHSCFLKIKNEKMGFCIAPFCVLTSNEDTNLLSENLVNLHDNLTGLLIKNENPALISMRQKNKVQIAMKCMDDAIELINQKDFPEKISSIINHARQSLQEIVGEIQVDHVLEKIFSTFCIGK